MALRTRRRISYMLPLSDATGGHRLGVNGLAYDRNRSILYSGGRDGLIYAWNVFDAMGLAAENSQSFAAHYRQHVQAHSHWINDLILVQNDSALISASSDNSVKIFSPHSEEERKGPHILGLHNDYVKCVASPGIHAEWVVAGGLDKKLNIWDIHGGGERLKINVTSDDDDVNLKGSVYAVDANESLIASGGPDKAVKIWDPRSGKRVTKFIGHTDNVRCILLASAGDFVMTGSSDQTVKVWSLGAGRCMYTLNMHNDSVWCLSSDHPQLSIFFSGDRAGFVAKSDTRGCADLEDGLSIAICQERTSVNKIACAHNSIWTATSDSALRNWLDVDTGVGIQFPGKLKLQRPVLPQRQNGLHPSQSDSQNFNGATEPQKIPANCVLRLSNARAFSPRAKSQAEKGLNLQHGHRCALPGSISELDIGPFTTLRAAPIETISGQSGLVKHAMLNNRRHVLTADSEGFVNMWNILECRKVASFGKRPLEDVLSETNTKDAVASWCTVDTRTGTLTCVLEERHCFEAEIYADEVENISNIKLKEDQRTSYHCSLFHIRLELQTSADEGVLSEEIHRDQAFREDLFRRKPQSSAKLDVHSEGFLDTNLSKKGQMQTNLVTSGSSIGIATPGILLATPIPSGNQQDAKSMRTNKSSDYFSLKPPTSYERIASASQQIMPTISTFQASLPGSPNLDPEKDKNTGHAKEGSSLFGKRVRIPFSNKRTPKPSLFLETAKQDSHDLFGEHENPLKKDDNMYTNTLAGVVEQIRNEYCTKTTESAFLLETLIAPSNDQETPPIDISRQTTVIIQEEREGSWGMTDLFDGMLMDIDRRTSELENALPAWAGNFLLRNQVPMKDVVKITFLLEPYDELLPRISSGESGTERLNANRMLRAKKISIFVLEKLREYDNKIHAEISNSGNSIELYCQNHLIHPRMTLAAIRMHFWRSSGDLVLAYRSNSRSQSYGTRGSL